MKRPEDEKAIIVRTQGPPNLSSSLVRRGLHLAARDQLSVALVGSNWCVAVTPSGDVRLGEPRMEGSNPDKLKVIIPKGTACPTEASLLLTPNSDWEHLNEVRIALFVGDCLKGYLSLQIPETFDRWPLLEISFVIDRHFIFYSTARFIGTDIALEVVYDRKFDSYE